MDHAGPNEQPPPTEQPIRGAEAIAEFIFGDRSCRRKIYYLAERTKLPIYRLGSTLYLRPSAYRAWVENQEARANLAIKRNS